MQRPNAATIVNRLARTVGITRRVTPHALRRSYITDSFRACCCAKMQGADRHTRTYTTVAYDQSDRSFHRGPTFVLATTTAC